MAIQLRSTRDLRANGVKVLVYGQAGAGKTSLIATAPSPIVISAEGGLLSIAAHEIPYVEIRTMEDLIDAYNWACSSDDAKQFETICLDSISEVAEVCLAYELKAQKDGRAAYGEMGQKMTGLIRAFRDLPRNVYMSAKLEKSQDEMGRILYAPSMPGKSLTMQLPYFFDEVLALRVEKDAEGVAQRALMCDGDGLWSAKDRSGRLDMWEQPDLGAVFRKIAGAE
jgi:phage nucleotide-binding protein